MASGRERSSITSLTSQTYGRGIAMCGLYIDGSESSKRSKLRGSKGLSYIRGFKLRGFQ